MTPETFRLYSQGGFGEEEIVWWDFLRDNKKFLMPLQDFLIKKKATDKIHSVDDFIRSVKNFVPDGAIHVHTIETGEPWYQLNDNSRYFYLFHAICQITDKYAGAEKIYICPNQEPIPRANKYGSYIAYDTFLYITI